MKSILRLEELAMFLLCIFLFGQLDLPWWTYAVLLLAPDLGALGYLVGPKVGAYSYNLTHHKGVAILLYVGGAIAASSPLQLAGLIILGHSSLDRVFGFGLKYEDAFQHTHLGWMGR